MNFIPPQDETRLRAAASGVLPNGKPVAVNADGTVSVVGGTAQSLGSKVVFDTANINQYMAATFDSNSNKVIIVYADGDNSNYGTAIVGTVSGSSISFGTAVTINSGYIVFPDAVFDTNSNKVVIVYTDGGNSSYGTARVGTISGTDISFGTAAVFHSVASNFCSAAFDSNSNKVVIAYKTGGKTGQGIVGTVSGTNISFGSVASFGNVEPYFTNSTFDSTNNKVVIVYKNNDDSSGSYAVVATVSGTNVSFGTPVRFTTENTLQFHSVTFDSNAGKVVIAFKGASTYGTAIVGNVSGTGISFGTAVVFQASAITQVSATFDSNLNKVVIAFSPTSTTKATFISGTVSGTSISFGSSIDADSTSGVRIANPCLVFDSNSNKVVLPFENDADSDKGTAVVYTTGNLNLTAENYVGMSSGGQVASGSSATVDIIGTVANIPEEFFSLNSAVYANKSFNVSSQESLFLTFFIGNSGTKFYALGYGNDTVYQYTLSTAFDISTASYDSVSFSVSSQVSIPRTLTFKPDGTKMYMGDYPTLYQYTLSTAWNVSTASYDSVTFTPSSQTSTSHDVIFSPDGTKLYNTGLDENALFQYTLSTPYNIGTASYANKTLDTSSQDGTPYGLALNLDGTKLFLLGGNTKNVFQYNLSTAYDLSTAVFSNISFDASAQGNGLMDCQFSSDGSNLYICSLPSDSILQYNTLSSLTPGQSYFVQTDGTLALTAGSPSVFAGTAISATKLLVKS